MAPVDHRGRIADLALIRALGWVPGPTAGLAPGRHDVAVNDPDAYDTALSITVQFDIGGRVDRPTAAQLSEAIELIGSRYGDWLACSPLPDRQAHFVQAARLPSGAYEVETRDGVDAELTFRRVPDGDEVILTFLDRIRAWATEPERATIPTTAAPEVPVGPGARAYADEVATAEVAAGTRAFPAA